MSKKKFYYFHIAIPLILKTMTREKESKNNYQKEGDWFMMSKLITISITKAWGIHLEFSSKQTTTLTRFGNINTLHTQKPYQWNLGAILRDKAKLRILPM